MNEHINVRFRFLAIIVVFLMILSALPVWSGEPNFDHTVKLENGKSKIKKLEMEDIDTWYDILGFSSDLEFDSGNGLEIGSIIGSEVQTLRADNTKVFADSNNKITYQIYSEDIHYKNNFDQWEEFDFKVESFAQKPFGDGQSYDYASRQNTIQNYFQGEYDSENSILTVLGDDYLGWEPGNMAFVDFDGEEFVKSEPKNVNAVVYNDHVLYPSTYKNTADLFTVKKHTLKHEIILTSVPKEKSMTKTEYLSHSGTLSPSSSLSLYEFGYYNPIIKETITDNPLVFRSQSGSNRFFLPAPLAYELENPSVQIPCKYDISPDDDDFKLSILTPYAWLSDPARAYPVVIDPTVTFGFAPTEYLSNDTYISFGNNLKVDDNFGNDKFLLIGGQYLNDSALLKFDISALPEPEITFQQALLKLRTASYENFGTTPAYVSIHKVTQNWIEGTGTKITPNTDGATWNGPSGASSSWTTGPGGAYDSAYVNRTLVAGENEDYDFDVGVLLSGTTGWRKKPSTNYGVLVRYQDRESFPNDFKAFHSSNSDSNTYIPKLEVSFLNTPPSVKPLNRYVWKEDQDLGTLIDLDLHFSDADHQPLKITLWNGSAWGSNFDCPIYSANLVNEGNPSSPNYFCYITLKPNQYGTQVIVFNATDKISYSEATITIEVHSVNDPPILQKIGNQEAIEGVYLELPLQVSDVEGQTVYWDTNVSTYGDPNYKDNLELIAIPEDPSNGYKRVLRYLPENEDVPRISVSIMVRDTKEAKDWENITINITNVNEKPLLTKVEYSVVINQESIILSAKQGVKKTVHIQAYDEDIINNDVLSFSTDVDEIKGLLEIIPLTGQDIPNDFQTENTQVIKIEFTPKNEHVGEYIVILTVEDTQETTDQIELKFNVENTNDPPEIESKAISQPSDGSVHNNRDIINLSCVVTDPDLDLPESVYKEKLNVTWIVNSTSQITVLGYGIKIYNKNFKAGDHPIVILVTDSEGLEARSSFNLKVEKSITLQEGVDRSYNDNTSADDIEYSYNTKTKKITITQGISGDIDVVKLQSYYDSETENLVIVLKFYENITLPIYFSIRIFLVKHGHRETEADYNVEYSSNFYEKVLYKPGEDDYYGYFTESDGTFERNEFIVEYSLADLEQGVIGEFDPIESDFEIFALVKQKDTEYIGNAQVENIRYDGIGHISAFVLPPSERKEEKSSDDGMDLSFIALIVVVIIIIVFLLVFMLLKSKKKDKEKTVIDFSKSTGPSRAPIPPTQVPQMFMSPFEQQFKQPGQVTPQTQPQTISGGPQIQAPGTAPPQYQAPRPPQQMQQQPMTTQTHYLLKTKY